MTKIVIEVDGVEHTLTIAQAEALFRDLIVLFDKRSSIPIDPKFITYGTDASRRTEAMCGKDIKGEVI